MKFKSLWILNRTVSKRCQVTFTGSEAIYILYGKGTYGLAFMIRGVYIELSLKYENYRKKKDV